MVELAEKNAMALGAGHSFIVFLGDGFYPVNVLNALKMVPEVCRIFCATANPVEVIVAETDQGRGTRRHRRLSPKGIEGADDVAWRKKSSAADRLQAVSGEFCALSDGGIEAAVCGGWLLAWPGTSPAIKGAGGFLERRRDGIVQRQQSGRRRRFLRDPATPNRENKFPIRGAAVTTANGADNARPPAAMNA